MRVLFVCTLLVFSNVTMACPLVKGRFVDFNCNQKLKIVVTGDSLVHGVGDEQLGGSGGYVKRLQKKMKVKFANMGIPGITSGGLLREFRKNKNLPKVRKELRNADIVIIDVGRNDYWYNGSGLGVARNIQRIISYLKKVYKKRGEKVVPHFVVSTLVPTARSFQQPFIEEVNEALLRFKNRRLPVTLLLHQNFGTEILSDDDLHPDSDGYEELAKFIRKYINGDLQVDLAAKRPDSDSDGIFNYFEQRRYNTNPKRKDSDKDGVLDGAEVFNRHTDPLDPLDF